MKGDLAARERSRRRGGDAGRAGEEGMRDGGSDKVNAGRDSREGREAGTLARAPFLQPLADKHGCVGALRSAEAEAEAANMLI